MGVVRANFVRPACCRRPSGQSATVLIADDQPASREALTELSIQVIYRSGYAESFPETQLPPNGTFLQKPFRFATLLEQLKCCNRKIKNEQFFA
jgi:hypothetical protein